MDIVVTGASNGIDAETTRVLALHGVHACDYRCEKYGCR